MNADRHSFSLSFICTCTVMLLCVFVHIAVCANIIMSFLLADLDKTTTPMFYDTIVGYTLASL